MTPPPQRFRYLGLPCSSLLAVACCHGDLKLNPGQIGVLTRVCVQAQSRSMRSLCDAIRSAPGAAGKAWGSLPSRSSRVANTEIVRSTTGWSAGSKAQIAVVISAATVDLYSVSRLPHLALLLVLE